MTFLRVACSRYSNGLSRGSSLVWHAVFFFFFSGKGGKMCLTDLCLRIEISSDVTAVCQGAPRWWCPGNVRENRACKTIMIQIDSNEAKLLICTFALLHFLTWKNMKVCVWMWARDNVCVPDEATLYLEKCFSCASLWGHFPSSPHSEMVFQIRIQIKLCFVCVCVCLVSLLELQMSLIGKETLPNAVAALLHILGYQSCQWVCCSCPPFHWRLYLSHRGERECHQFT